jgi:hypothetical protein
VCGDQVHAHQIMTERRANPQCQVVTPPLGATTTLPSWLQ